MRVYRRHKKKKQIFWWVYLGIAILMVALVGISVISVKGLLNEYEAKQPETAVKRVMEELKERSVSPEEFCSHYGVTVPTFGEYEADFNIERDYLKLFSDPAVEYAIDPTASGEDEMGYIIRCGEMTLAKVQLKATSPLVTKLAVFSMRDWEVTGITLPFEAKDYSLTLPSDFTVSVNGIPLNGTPGENNRTSYSVSGLYMEPDFLICDAEGNTADYYFSGNGQVLCDIYDYDLVLPSTLTVTLNGTELKGADRGDGYLTYSVTELEKPTLTVSDLYGNSLNYEGGEIPLSATTVLIKEGYTLTVDSKAVPDAAITEALSPEYEYLADVISDLPMEKECHIAILKKDAVIACSDSSGKALSVDMTKSYNDLTLTSVISEDRVPEDIASQIDVLSVAKNWSLFMSNDMSFDSLSAYLLPDSYQYDVAYKYSVSVDKTFFSGHYLLDPAFTDTDVRNFIRITEDSFSVDISLTKHMMLNSNQQVDDSMNDRFYFVNVNGSWLLAGMREVFDDAK